MKYSEAYKSGGGRARGANALAGCCKADEEERGKRVMECPGKSEGFSVVHLAAGSWVIHALYRLSVFECATN